MKKKKFILVLLLIIVAFFITACSSDANNEEATANETNTDARNGTGDDGEVVELTVSAAVSLTDALEEIQATYEKENNVKLTFNLAGSGTLAQQIQQGAPVDVFISANQDWMDTLEEDNELMNDTRDHVTGNSIVMITREDSDIDYDSFEDLSADDNLDDIAIGNPESVPAGNYTEQALKSINLWDELQDNLVLAKDVRGVLTYVESGNADLGFVYESDALTSDKIKILASSDPEWHDPIIYPGAVTAHTKHEKEATAFLEYMFSDDAQEVLKIYGFKQQ